MILLTVVINVSVGQEYVIIEKKNSKREHKLLLPQTMKFHYKDYGKVIEAGAKRFPVRYRITGHSVNGLITNDGVITMDFHKMQARRFKPLGTKISGWALLGLGFTGQVVAFGMAYNDPESKWADLVGLPSLGMIVGGSLMVKTRKTYKIQRWDLRLIPAEYVKSPVGEIELSDMGE